MMAQVASDFDQYDGYEPRHDTQFYQTVTHALQCQLFADSSCNINDPTIRHQGVGLGWDACIENLPLSNPAALPQLENFVGQCVTEFDLVGHKP